MFTTTTTTQQQHASLRSGFLKNVLSLIFFKNWANSRPLFVYFRPLYITIQIFKLKKAKRR